MVEPFSPALTTKPGHVVTAENVVGVAGGEQGGAEEGRGAGAQTAHDRVAARIALGHDAVKVAAFGEVGVDVAVRIGAYVVYGLHRTPL